MQINRPKIIWLLTELDSIQSYKITKIVHVLWLAKKHVCMRVCKHGSWQQDVLLFACKHEFEKGFELKNSSSLLYLPISSSAETWKIFRNMQRQCFFARADILSEKNFFSAKQGLSTRTSFVYKTLRLVRISLLISTLNKRVLLFPLESYFIKAIENFFPVFVYPDRNTRGVGKILDSYANPRLRLGFS